MPNHSAFDSLSPDELAEIDREFQRRNFKRLKPMLDWFQERGWDIGRGPMYRRSRDLKRRLEFVKASSQAMKEVAEAAKDDGADASSAVLALVQAEAFEVMLAMQEATDEDDTDLRLERLKNAALIAQRAGNTSVRVKQYQAKVQAALQAAADKSEAIAKKAGLSEEDWAAIRANFLGVEVEA